MNTAPDLRNATSLNASNDGCVYLGTEALQLQPKEQAALQLLLARAPALVSKEEFARQVWPKSSMSDESLARCMHRLRHVLREAEAEVQIEALYGRGYRLVQKPAVQSIAHQRLLAAAQAPSFLTEALILARHLCSQCTPASLAQAEKILRATIQQAPGYAPARIALAECLAAGNSWGVDIGIARIEEGLMHLDVAEQRAPGAVGMRSARAFLLDRAWRFREAGVASEQAMHDHPNDPDTNFHHGWHLLAIGKADAACQALQQAVGLHPYSVLLRITLARAYAHAGVAEEALREAKFTCDLFPGNEMAELTLTSFLAWQRPCEEVLASARKLAASPSALTSADSTLSYALARAGRGDEALEHIVNCTRRGNANACTNAMHASALLVLDRQDDAMRLMQQAYEARCGSLPILLHEPANAALKSHASYAELHRQVFSDLQQPI